jgi:hypothetical protein
MSMTSSFNRMARGVLFAAIAIAPQLGLMAQGSRPVAPDLADLARRGAVRLNGRQVSEVVEGDRRGLRLSAASGFGVAWIDGVTLSRGTIELDLRGKDAQGRSFVGVAFSGANDSAYETVYVRPFNFRTTDPVRGAHAVQYESMPTYSWSKLRSDFPEVYENPVEPSPEPTAWVRMRVVIEPARIRVYVGEGAEPDLTVDRIDPKTGRRVGLWVGNGSDGDFANLRITPAID